MECQEETRNGNEAIFHKTQITLSQKWLADIVVNTESGHGSLCFSLAPNYQFPAVLSMGAFFMNNYNHLKAP
jgi:hypothetical protein